MVGARGFEPPTPCSRSRCATRLRYAPTVSGGLPGLARICKRDRSGFVPAAVLRPARSSSGGRQGRRRPLAGAAEPAGGAARCADSFNEENIMPILLWLLGVPGIVIIILLLMGVF